MTQPILDEIVEVACRASWQKLGEPSGRAANWDDIPEGPDERGFDFKAGVREHYRAVLEAVAPLIEAQVKEDIVADLLERVAEPVRHRGGSAGVFKRAPNRAVMADWSYSNAVAYTCATLEILREVLGFDTSKLPKAPPLDEMDEEVPF